MRDLTREELELAPEWATHYAVRIHDVVVYQNDEFWWWSGINSDGQPTPLLNHVEVDLDALPIPRKPFDITKHEFSDVSLALNPYNNSNDGYLSLKIGFEGFSLNKQDAIAIAKALGVTAEDLK